MALNSWQIICRIKDAVPDNENGWKAVDVIWTLLEGQITQEEAVEALGELVENPVALLGEVGA